MAASAAVLQTDKSDFRAELDQKAVTNLRWKRGRRKDIAWHQLYKMEQYAMWRFYVVMGLAIGGTAAVMAGDGGSGSVNKDVTFNKDVAPILFRHCVACHRPGNIAPMSLLSYKEARPWAAAIREAVVSRKMPPWHADPNVGRFSNDARLKDHDIAILDAWAKSGAREGNPADLPRAPEFTERWHIQPDVVLTIPAAHLTKSSDTDEYAYIFVATNFTEDKWVKAAEVMPGDFAVVHHATVSVVSEERRKSVTPGETRTGQPNKYRYSTGAVLHIRPEVPIQDDGCASPGGGALGEQPKPVDFLAIYLPGHVPEIHPDGYAIKIPAGGVLQFQIHYHNRTGHDVADRTSIGLVFAKPPVRHRIQQYEIWNYTFAIPPGDPNHRVTSCYTLDRDVTALAYTGHMHYRGKSIRTEAFFPDGTSDVLFSVPHYDFRWQETYMLEQPRLLPKGTRLMTTAYFDNSANNPLNPDPSKQVRWGEPSDEEMMGFWLSFTDATESVTQTTSLAR
ncbi:MAG TPA: thiol-disulfide isomerase [Bryobacteraceae bacterium]|nr:thiol-disulfide isomerase [Bryobacteraceae bacterium]